METDRVLTTEEYRDTYLALHVCINARVPVILWGPPGQGKTSVIKALAAHEERRLEVLLASIREPQDFAGLPSIHDGQAALIPPNWAFRLRADGNEQYEIYSRVETAVGFRLTRELTARASYLTRKGYVVGFWDDQFLASLVYAKKLR
mgnify:CR=1 FL=1